MYARPGFTQFDRFLGRLPALRGVFHQLTFKILALNICNFSTAATDACGGHVYSLALAHVQSLFFCPCISPNVRDVTLSTSVDVAVLYRLQFCYVKSSLCPSLSFCFLKSILYSLLQPFWDAAKFYLNHVAHLFHCYQPIAFVTAKNFHNMNHLLLAAIYAKDRARNAVFLTLLNIQRGLLRRHEFSCRLRKLISKIILFRACSVYQFAVSMINLRCAYLNNPIGSSALRHAPACVKLIQQKLQNFCACFRVRFKFTSSDVHQLNKRHHEQVGGSGRRLHHEFSSIEAYVVSDVPDVQCKSNVQYVSHVDDVGLLDYSSPPYIHASIPLSILFNLITLTDARKIAAVHGISVGSRCTIAQLLLSVENHSCQKCSSYISVFSSELNVNISAERSKRYRDRKKSQACDTGKPVSTTSKSPQFPPNPASDNLECLILTNACKKMQPDHFTEAGCAVCGELKPIRTMSRLKSMKNYLHILETQGVTHVERKSAATSVKEYKGAVLDYSCNRICDTCRVSVRNGKVPRISLANNLWIGKVPEELSSLRYVEKMLIARVRHTCAYVKVASGMRKMKANIIAFESPVPKIYSILPPPRDDLDDVLAILFTGPKKPTPEDFARTPFLVRRNVVIRALEWLKLNHADYADIEISHKNMKTYEENAPPVSVEYRESINNKVPEGTSVFDQEEEDGTEEGDCSFTVHGLTGEACNSMTPNALKAIALRHLNSGGKILAVGHSDKFESMWNNPQLYPQMFPWLFPYGLGGIGASSISHKEHKRHLLMYHDKRFQVDINFPFVAFSHEQMRANSTQSFLLVDQHRFQHISHRLMNVHWPTLDGLTRRLETGEHVIPKTDSEKACFHILSDLDAISGKMHGSTTSKKYMRNEIWSLINYLGAPYWYITLSPADIMHPICIYFAGSKEEFTLDLSSYDERIRLVCRNPIAGARFFHFMIQTFISDVLGVDATHPGFYGQTSGYYGTVEQQGRLTLHMHLLLWIMGSLNPQEMRDKILGGNSIWRQKLIDWLERCHTGDFLSGTKDEVAAYLDESKKKSDYTDPTQSLPKPPPKECTIHSGINAELECKPCAALLKWKEQYNRTTDDLLFRSNVHSCNRGTRKDGTRKKNKASPGCMDNKWGKCRARFPRLTALKSFIDETGAITMKKLEAWINTFTPLVTYIFRCNTDVTCLSSGTAIKGVAMYVSDYITKSSLKTHVIFDSIRTVFQKNGDIIGGTLPVKEKARRLMTKVANLLSAKAEMGAPMIAMYLLGNPDHYTSHTFLPFYWQSYVQEVQNSFSNELKEPQKVTVIMKKGKIVGLSPIHDYLYRPDELSHVNLYQWIRCYKREKLPQRKRKAPADEDEADDQDEVAEISQEVQDAVDHDASFESDLDGDNPTQKVGRLIRFRKGHPLHDSHGVKYISNNANRVPNFAGANLPRCDQGDREYYCCTMLTLFKPWRKGSDLKSQIDESWDNNFHRHTFNEEEQNLMKNFNIRYECLDARDDFRSQMKKGMNPITCSWDAADDGDLDNENPHASELNTINFDDIPIDPLNSGPRHNKRMKEMEAVNHMMTSLGWTEPLPSACMQTESFQPEVILTGSLWEQEVEKAKQNIQKKKNENNIPAMIKAEEIMSQGLFTPCDPNVVRVVDKSYLDKNFQAGKASDLIDATVQDYSLNEEQERAFRIIANHAVCQNHEQLCMYIGGMGGTGKSQVIKALSHFFLLRKEAHRFVIVAPTGTAAALLGGSTYHSMFGINDRMSSTKKGHIKEKLSGVEYVFFDEVSMLSARDMYRINAQLAKVFDRADVPFGGLNMVFSGDFAQLPPAIGGEHVSLYSRTIGSLSTDIKSQEEAVGKALWHQVTTVVILRQNMRQNKQSVEDAKLRTALENMRYKACTAEDINFLRTCISSNLPKCASICDRIFRDVSIITGTNLHKDEINKLGALRFAEETGQNLIDFFSDDSPRSNPSDSEQTTGTKRVNEITDEMQSGFWSQPPSSTDKHIAGKLSLCIGLPVMIRYNFATELCMTRGQEGFVCGWQSKNGSRGQLVLDTLFIKLKDPPTNIQLNGLPENVVPVYQTTTNVQITLPNDERYYITRSQVEVLVNFAMTDFGSQGKTRPTNVSDLNNLSTHQSYYTALSRSATAKGTLILQGFDARKITGGCSGALRQEFRELELLDDITNLRYLGKLPATVYGDTRNNVISTFRQWRGLHYIPRQVHRAIRWSKHDPLIEVESRELDTQLAIVNNMKTHKNTGKIASKKIRSSGIPATDPLSFPIVPNASKNKMKEVRDEAGQYPHYLSPKGMRWSNNSCAYDSLFTPLFTLWCSDREGWKDRFNSMNNAIALELINGFFRYEQAEISLEDARDYVRQMLSRSHHELRFGLFASIERLCEVIFATSYLVRETYYLCPNNHRERQSEAFDVVLDKGTSAFESISEWVSTCSEQASHRCRICQLQAKIEYRFKAAPPLLAFSFPGSSTDIDHSFELTVNDKLHKYHLSTVIYYREVDAHFVSYVIMKDGQIWFYDGMSYLRNPTMEYCGTLHNQPPQLETCRGGQASVAIYAQT